MHLVKNSWSYVIVNAEEAGRLFYGRLFEVAPGVRHMFKGDISEQSRKLMNMVTLVISKLQKLDDIEKRSRGWLSAMFTMGPSQSITRWWGSACCGRSKRDWLKDGIMRPGKRGPRSMEFSRMP